MNALERVNLTTLSFFVIIIMEYYIKGDLNEILVNKQTKLEFFNNTTNII